MSGNNLIGSRHRRNKTRRFIQNSQTDRETDRPKDSESGRQTKTC